MAVAGSQLKRESMSDFTKGMERENESFPDSQYDNQSGQEIPLDWQSRTDPEKQNTLP